MQKKKKEKSKEKKTKCIEKYFFTNKRHPYHSCLPSPVAFCMIPYQNCHKKLYYVIATY